MNGFTDEWICMCCLRPDDVLNCLPHSGQALAPAACAPAPDKSAEMFPLLLLLLLLFALSWELLFWLWWWWWLPLVLDCMWWWWWWCCGVDELKRRLLALWSVEFKLAPETTPFLIFFFLLLLRFWLRFSLWLTDSLWCWLLPLTKFKSSPLRKKSKIFWANSFKKKFEFFEFLGLS